MEFTFITIFCSSKSYSSPEIILIKCEPISPCSGEPLSTKALGLCSSIIITSLFSTDIALEAGRLFRVKLNLGTLERLEFLKGILAKVVYRLSDSMSPSSTP